jgi:hypothetical protein
MKNFILSFFLLMSFSGTVHADAITFQATINSPRISLDEVLQLTLTFTGVNQDLDAVSLPVLDGFSAKYLGPSTSVSIVNGNYHSERSFIYNLFPNKTGHFQIPPISATVGGQTYTTKPIDVEVFQSTSQAQSGQPADPNQPPNAENLKNRVLMMVAVAKRDVYLHEQIPLSIKLLVNGVPMRDIQYPQFEKNGFTIDDFGQPQQSSEVVNGVRYDTVEFKTNIYPNRLGDLTFGPAQMAGNVVYKTGQNNPFGGDNAFFGSDVFNNFFDSYAARPVTISSQPIVLHVSPLPENNRPPDFSGAIGQFDFDASVSPLQVKAGDPLTLKMEVKGQGDFKNLKMPAFSDPGFKSYDPQIKSAANDKTAEQVIIPISAGTKEVPALHFTYFDTVARDYKTITRGPFAIQVTQPSPEQDFKAVGFSDISKGESAAVSANQSIFKGLLNTIHKLFNILVKASHSFWFWLSLGCIVLAGGAYFIWSRFQQRLEQDQAFARRFKAIKEAKQVLTQAETYISKAETKNFYTALSKALRDYLANKWHQSSAALSVNDILARLKSAGISQALIDQVRTMLEYADLVCFAGASADSAKMQQDLSQTRDLIAHLEKSLR